MCQQFCESCFLSKQRWLVWNVVSNREETGRKMSNPRSGLKEVSLSPFPAPTPRHVYTPGKEGREVGRAVTHSPSNEKQRSSERTFSADPELSQRSSQCRLPEDPHAPGDRLPDVAMVPRGHLGGSGAHSPSHSGPIPSSARLHCPVTTFQSVPRCFVLPIHSLSIWQLASPFFDPPPKPRGSALGRGVQKLLSSQRE